ncbi:N-alpha-acetyltransferase 80 [Chelonus insularis]|uniref:N-alpha-acetyltransferase 80 n=1 Tax=Chelonus insularis TaxID=460826 RepID=UPI00158E6C8D|nr:N-alpha-acetyltransferase 80 [Chelonus insularis]
MTLGVLTNGINSIINMAKNEQYTVIPIHKRPDLLMDCCKLINSEWPSSEGRRLRTLSMSCESFPTCLVLLNDSKVIGHCKVSLLPSRDNSCFIESVVIDYGCRSQGLGSMLLRKTEEYVINKGIKRIYLATKGQEKFYLKNGYNICEPINVWECNNWVTHTQDRSSFLISKKSCGPPPPPLPISLFSSKKSTVVTSKTYMVKIL